ncbi:MAG: undecaprenyl-diphosphate phosphatase [Candidatus Omnitrophota bacterium]
MIKLILLGFVQGLTEFFPVSSSAHLIIGQHFLGLTENLVFLDISLHIGTLLSLFAFFYKDILASLRNPRMLGLILIVTVVTAAIGLSFMKLFRSCFESPSTVAAILVLNGLLILGTKFIKKGERKPGPFDSVLTGFSQGLAITPGLSRSGATISTLLLRRIHREEAFLFSFLASIPAILGAFVYEARDVDWTMIREYSPAALAAGILSAFLTGLLALWILKKSLTGDKFHVFGYYCLLAGTAFFLLLKFR